MSPPSRKGSAYLISYGVALVGSAVSSLTPVSVTLALRIGAIDPVGKNTAYGLAVGIGTLLGMFVTPLAGLLSDATYSRRGMRIPWLVVGSFGTLLAAYPLSQVPNVAGVFLCWALMTLFISLGFSPLMAIIQDQLPESQHGIASGMAGTAPFLGGLLGSWIVQLLPQTPFNLFVIPAALGGAMILQFLIFLDDKTQSRSKVLKVKVWQFLQGFRFDWRTNPSFAWLLLVVATSWTGMAVMQTYMVYILQDQIKVGTSLLAGAAFQGFVASNTTAAGVSLLGGAFSDWLGRRRAVYACGVVLLALGLVAQALSSSMSVFLFGCLVAGVGSGLMTGLTWALAAEASADRATSGRDMGLIVFAFTLPTAVVPLAAPALLSTGGGGNYAVLFFVCAAVTFLGAPLLALVHRVR